MKIKPILFGYSWLGILNILLIQWFFVRLQATADHKGNVIKFNIIGFLLPMTGWWSRYIWVFKKFTI